MSAIDTKFYQKRNSSIFYGALSFFVLIIGLTGALYFYQTTLEKDNISLQQEITLREQSITEIQASEKVQIYSIYEKHTGIFQKMADESKIPTFVNHIKKYLAKYSIQGKGFNYSDGTATVALSSQTKDSSYASQKIVQFLSEYSEEEKAMFELQPVLHFTGYDTIKYTGKFTLK